MFLFGSWALLCNGFLRLFGTPLSSAGSAHFATAREVRKSGLLNETGLPLAVWKNGQIMREPRGSHVAVIAPPRSRKSWGVIMPVLRHFKGSVICTDLRAELHEHTGQAREAYGPAYVFNPTSPDSCALNVLDSVRWNTIYTFGDVDRIVHHMLAPTGNAIEDGFKRNAIPLLRAVIFDRYSAGLANFPSVLEWLTDPTRAMNDKLASLLSDSPDPFAQRGARNVMNMSVKLRQGVWSALVEILGIFEDPTIRQNTGKSDVFLEDLISGPDPVTIYLTMPFHEVGRLGRFFGLFVECIVVSSVHHTSKPGHALLLCLDEMANLGKLTGLEKAVSYLQGSGCQCVFVFQNVNQIVDTYGETSPLLSSVSTSVFYAPTPTDITTSTLISRALGQATITTLSTSLSPGPIGEYQSHTASERARALLTPDEVTRIPNTDALIFTQEHPPMYASKLGGTPPTTFQRTCTALARHPGMAATLAACCAMAVALWPLTRLSPPPLAGIAQSAHAALSSAASDLDPSAYKIPSTPSTPSTPPTPAPTATRERPSTSPLWHLRYTDTPIGEDHPEYAKKIGPMVRDQFPTANACLAGLAHHYEAQLKMLEHQASIWKAEISRQPGRYTWSKNTSGNGRRHLYEAWCEEQAAAKTP